MFLNPAELARATVWRRRTASTCEPHRGMGLAVETCGGPRRGVHPLEFPQMRSTRNSRLAALHAGDLGRTGLLVAMDLEVGAPRPGGTARRNLSWSGLGLVSMATLMDQAGENRSSRALIVAGPARTGVVHGATCLIPTAAAILARRPPWDSSRCGWSRIIQDAATRIGRRC